MTSANKQVTDEDFEFHEHDLRHVDEPGVRADAEERLDAVDAPRQLEDDLYQEEVDSEPLMPAEPAQASFFAKYGIYIGVGVLALAAMCVLGWVAIKILSPAPVHGARASAPEPFSAQPIKARAQNSGAVEPVQFGADPTAQPNARDQRPQEASASHQSVDEAPGSVLPITPRTEQEQDEEFYDTLVSAAEQNTPAPAAIDSAAAVQTVTPVQVNPETADKFAAISVAIANQSKEMATVLEAVKSVSAEIKTLKAQVEASSTKSNLVEGKLNQLTLSLTDFTKNTESRFNDISKAAVAAAVQAVKKESSRNSAGNGKLVLVGGPLKSDYTSAKAKHEDKKTTTKTMAEPSKPSFATAPVEGKPQAQPESGNQALKCGAKTISQVWKVKGLTYSGAYVRRDDGSALMLRADMEVPGFGRVKSFDPESRTVCTTSGLIAR